MTVVGRVGQTPVKFLVDTGDSCTLIAESTYKQMAKEKKHIEKTDKEETATC